MKLSFVVELGFCPATLLTVKTTKTRGMGSIKYSRTFSSRPEYFDHPTLGSLRNRSMNGSLYSSLNLDGFYNIHPFLPWIF